MEEAAELARTEVGLSAARDPEPERGRNRRWSRYLCWKDLFGGVAEGVDVDEDDSDVEDADAETDGNDEDDEEGEEEEEAVDDDDDADDVDVNDTDRHGSILTEIWSISFTAISTAAENTCPATACEGDVTRLQPKT